MAAAGILVAQRRECGHGVAFFDSFFGETKKESARRGGTRQAHESLNVISHTEQRGVSQATTSRDADMRTITLR